MAAATVNVSALIDRGVSPYQMKLFAVCFLISLVDGLDSQILSVVGPVMARDLQLPPGALGPLLSASQWGSLVGAFAVGFFADRWGRRQSLLWCGVLFSAATLATAWASAPSAIFALRVLAGLGIGGAVPCYLALASEYAPESKRAGVVTIVLGAVPTGGILAGLLGASLLNNFDWRIVFMVCGVFSILTTILTYVSLPESLSFMIVRNHALAKIRAIVAKMDPKAAEPDTAQFSISEEIKLDAPVRNLFTEARAVPTILLWIAFFIAYLSLIGTLVWTPILTRQAGMSIAEGALALTFNNIGAIVGMALAGQIIDRYRSSLFALLAATFLIGGGAIVMIGYATPSFILVSIASALAGFAMAAGVSGLYALCALIYPTFMRSTGMGWGSGFGRVGSSLGPMLVGVLFAAKWSTSASFVTLGLIALVNIVVMAVLAAVSSRRRATSDAMSAPVAKTAPSTTA